MVSCGNLLSDLGSHRLLAPIAENGKAYAAGSVSLRHSRIGSGRFLLDKGDGADQSLGQAPAE